MCHNYIIMRWLEKNNCRSLLKTMMMKNKDSIRYFFAKKQSYYCFTYGYVILPF